MNLVERMDSLSEEQRKQILAKTNEDMEVVVRKARELEKMIIDHNHPEYTELRKKIPKGKYNGCWYYSNEIVKNIIPNVKTWRGWNTVGRELTGMQDHMIVFLHDNSTPWHYDWLKKYKDLVLICSSEYTLNSVIHSGHTVLLPMSIDTEYVKRFKVEEKTKDTCFAGNVWVKENMTSPDLSVLIAGKVDFFSGLPREKLLRPARGNSDSWPNHHR